MASFDKSQDMRSRVRSLLLVQLHIQRTQCRMKHYCTTIGLGAFGEPRHDSCNSSALYMERSSYWRWNEGIGRLVHRLRGVVQVQCRLADEEHESQYQERQNYPW